MEVLDPLESGAFIVKGSEDVSVDEKGIDAAADLILAKMRSGEVEDTDWLAQELHPKSGGADAANWILLADAINFSFWSEPGAKWIVTRKGKQWTGYFAACAAINNALDSGLPLTSPYYYANVSLAKLKEIFTDDAGTPIPMLKERHEILHETGRIVEERFKGSFINCVEEANGSARKMLELIVTAFPSFRDEAEFGGRRVGIYKRAQILVADAWRALRLNLTDIHRISVFADYRVPQVLAYLGALKYSQRLREKLAAKEMVEPGSELEIQIRGATIHASHLVTEAMKAKLAAMAAEERPTAYADINDVIVDNFLWCYRRSEAEAVEAAVPFHRTRSIYY